MFIVNIDDDKITLDIIKTSNNIGEYLCNIHKIPVLSKDKDGNYIFSNTKMVRDAIDKLPFEFQDKGR